MKLALTATIVDKGTIYVLRLILQKLSLVTLAVESVHVLPQFWINALQK